MTSPRPSRAAHGTVRRTVNRRRRGGVLAGAPATLLLIGLAAGPSAAAVPVQEDGRGQAVEETRPVPSGPVGYKGSRWWPQVEETEELLRKERWKQGLRAIEELLDQVVRRSWEEPDLAAVLASLSVERAVAEAALGRTEAALWHWHAALNLAPSVEAIEARLGDYGEVADLLRGVPLRRRGRLPDGTVPPPRFTTPGYEPVTVVRPPSTGMFENASLRGRQVQPVSLEVVVGEDGRLSRPLVTSRWVHPVVVYWTLERCLTADYEIRPARIGGRPVADLEEIEMEFEATEPW